MSGSPPEHIGRYRIISELGEGAMGRVYLAEDPNIDRKVAVKVFSPGKLGSRKASASFGKQLLAEAKAAGRLNHPGIVTIHDAGIDETAGPYVVMEWIDGRSLAEILHSEGPLPVARASAWLAEVAEALDYAHRQGLIHRDVKPSNILVDAEGRARIIDFGVAKVEAQAIVRTSTVAGTPPYMAPELVQGEPIDPRSDLFSLVACYYELITGELAFQGENLSQVLYAIVNAPPRPARLGDTVSGQRAGEVLEIGLDKSPERRFQTGQELARHLREVVDVTPVAMKVGQSPAMPPVEVGTRSARRRLTLMGMAVTVVVALIAGSAIGAGLFTRDVSPEEVPIERPESVALGLTQEPKDPELSARPVDLIDVATDRSEPIADEGALETSTLSFRYRNRLRRANVTVWVDGERRWSTRVETSPLRKLTGRRVETSIDVPIGSHDVEVRITGDNGKIDEAARVHLAFDEAGERRLRANLRRGKLTLLVDS